MKRFYLMLMFLIATGVASCGRGFPELPKDGLGVDTTTAIPTPPIVISATAYAENKVKVLFSTNMNESSAEIIANYTIANSNLVLVRATMSKTNSMVVYLDTSNMSALSNYSLSCSGIIDIAGLSVVVDDNTFAGYGSGDTTAPIITITEPVTDQWLNKSYLVYGTASDDSGILKVELWVDGGTRFTASNTVNWSHLLNTGAYQEDITHIIYAKATDLKGNSIVTYVSISIDRTDPILVVTSSLPSGDIFKDFGETITIEGWATDNKQFSTIAVYISNYNGNFQYGGTWTDGSNWSVDINSTTMADESTNFLTLSAQDFAGNIISTNTTYFLSHNVIYVRTNGSANGDGTYWFPKNTIYGASSMNPADWNEIKVANGMYTQAPKNLFLSSEHIIKGGYSQDFSSRNVNSRATIISNNSLSFCLGYTIDGFKIIAQNMYRSYNGTYITLTFLNNYFQSSLITGESMEEYKFYSNTFVSNISIQTYGATLFENNIMSNISIYFKTDACDAGNPPVRFDFNNNTVYGELDVVSSASIATVNYITNTYISNTFIGIGEYTNIAISVAVDEFPYSPYPPSITHVDVMVKNNIFSNYQIGIWYSNRNDFDNTFDIIQNKFYTKDYAIYEYNNDSEPTHVISNGFKILDGYYYYDPERAPTDVGTLADLNALDEAGWNPVGTVYSNYNITN